MQIKYIVRIIAFLDIIWIWVLVPILPELMKYYDVSYFHIILGTTVYSIFTFISAPLLWQLSDKFWRKKILWICVSWTIIWWFIIALYPKYIWFLIGRMITWILWWNISILQSILMDISNTKNEAKKNLWIFVSIFWMAFIVWPFIGSVFMNFGIKWPFWFVVFLNFISIFTLIFYLKETNKHISDNKNLVLKYNTLWIIFENLKIKPINILIISMFLFYFWVFMYQSIMTLILFKHFSISWQIWWYIMSALWVVVMINQIFFMEKFWLKKFNDKKLFNISFISNIIVYFIMIIMFDNLYVFLCGILVPVIFVNLLRPIYMVEITKYYDEHKRWQVNWMIQSINVLTMIFWSLLWWMFLNKDINVFYWTFLFVIISYWFIFYYLKNYYIEELKI